MAGNTGKMTREELARRGERMMLVRFPFGKVICKRPNLPWTLAILNNLYAKKQTGTVIARSFSLSYLLKIAKVN